MTTQNTTLAATKTSARKDLARPQTLEQTPQYVLCAVLGLIGGAAGVALTIGLVIVAKLWLSPAVIFAPSIVLLTIAATVIGLGISWLAGFSAHRLLPTLFYSTRRHGLPVILVFSTLASLLQSLLFLGSL